MKEVYERGRDFYHSVAVVKKGSLENVKTMHDLKGAKACFARVGSLAGERYHLHPEIQPCQFIF